MPSLDDVTNTREYSRVVLIVMKIKNL